MAIGNVYVYNRFRLDIGKEVHDLSADTFKVGIIKASPSAGTPSDLTLSHPCWGAGGSQDFSADEVATLGGNYTAPITVTMTWTEVETGVMMLDCTSTTTITANASNPATDDARWAIYFNETAANNECMFAVDLGSAIDMVPNTIVLTPGALGIYRTS